MNFWDWKHNHYLEERDPFCLHYPGRWISFRICAASHWDPSTTLQRTLWNLALSKCTIHISIWLTFLFSFPNNIFLQFKNQLFPLEFVYYDWRDKYLLHLVIPCSMVTFKAVANRSELSGRCTHPILSSSLRHFKREILNC